ncbi:MAG: FecR family protein [Planctomycetaceae bacterium]
MNRSTELITNYLDDALSDQEVAELQTWLESDPAHLEEFVKVIARNEQLRKVVKSMNIPHAPVPQTNPPPPRKPVSQSGRWTKWILAASLMVAVCWFMFPRENNASVVTFEGGSAQVVLQTDNGSESGLSAGETFTTARLQVGGDGTRAKFTYADGSSVLAAGGSEVTFGTGGGKQLLLNHGTLAANVTSDAKQNPLILRTPTAEAVAQGTSFIVDAEESDTLLRVNRGTVQLRRLSDNQTMQVAQNQQVNTEVVAGKPLHAKPVEALPATWTASPKREGKLKWYGEWTDGGILKAGSEEVFLKDFKVKETHYHAGAHNDFPGLVTLNEKSAIRVRYRIDMPLNIGVFISTHSPTWDFTGNFQAYLVQEQLQPDTDGWRTATIPIGSFQPMRRTGMPFKPGSVAATIYLTSYATDAGLEVASLEVITVEAD